MDEYVICDICGFDEAQVLYGDMPHSCGPIVKCMQCGLIYVNPRVGGQQKFLQPEIAQTYLDQLEWKVSVLMDRLDVIERYKKEGRLLDIGCYTGAFLNIAQNAGWDCFGIEPSDSIAAYARDTYGVTVYPYLLRDLDLENDSVDVVTMFHVLEHLDSPSSELKEIRRILRPNGLLVIEVPNVESWMRGVLKRTSWTFNKEHYYHFCYTTLRNLLEKERFRVVNMKSAVNHIHFKRILYILDHAYKDNLSQRCTAFLRRIGIGKIEFKLGLGTSILAVAQPQQE